MSDFDEQFQKSLREVFYAGASDEFLNSREFFNSWKEHAYDRTDRFGRHLLPWIQNVFDLGSANVLEIGCGTGSITAVLAPNSRSVTCFEIDEKSMRMAQRRAELMGWQNVSHEQGAFSRDCEFVRRGSKVDVAAFVGVVEHMNFDVMEEVLSTSYEVLNPGGVIVIADTPNRLSAFDYHSSWLPFFQWLPDELKKRYYLKSPRYGFVSDLQEFERIDSDAVLDRIQSWGVGVSYHDFELILGDDVHQKIIADGWDRHVEPLANLFSDDGLLLSIWEHRQVKAHKAFARSWLYLIIQKPYC